MRLCLGGYLYPCPETVRSVLAPVAGRTKRILDIGKYLRFGSTLLIELTGCGNRTWFVSYTDFVNDSTLTSYWRALEMAQEFPHVEVWGWDRPQVREIWSGAVPTNCRFETAPDYDFLENYENEFDLIHMRFVAGGVSIHSVVNTRN